MATAIKPLSLHHDKILQNNLKENAIDKNYSSICLYKPISGGALKYGLMYKKQTHLLKDVQRMEKGYKENKEKGIDSTIPPALSVKPPKDPLSEVYVIPIDNLYSKMNGSNFYEIVREKDITLVNKLVSGATIDDNSGIEEGNPACYNDEYGVVYGSQSALFNAAGYYCHEDTIWSENTDGYVFFVSFNKLLKKEIVEPFEEVKIDKVHFLLTQEQSKNQADRVPGTPFGSATKKKNAAKVRIDETPAVMNLNVSIVSKDAKNNTSMKKNRELDLNRNIVTPFEASAKKVVYEKYIGRVPGPSDIIKALNAADNKRVRKSLTEDEKNEEREIEINQQEIYKNLRTNVGWHHDMDPDDPNNEVFFTPLSKPTCKEGIENLTFFHTRKACYKHFKQNPCLGYSSKEEIMTLLNKHGWIEEEKLDDKIEGTYSMFTYQPAKDSIKKLKVGHHFFNNYQTLLQFISKFPFPFQEDDVFVDTLRLHGWTNSSDKKWHFKDKNLGPYTLSDMRRELWLNPALLFQNMSPALSSETVLNFIIVPEEEAGEIITSPVKSHKPKKSDTSISSHTSKEPKKKPINDEDDEGEQVVAPSSSELKELAREYVQYLAKDDKQSSEKTYIQMMKLMKPADGWIEHSCNWTDQWWKHEKVTFPPWTTSTLNKKKTINFNTMTPGIDFFWCFEDIANYINAYGVQRNSHPLKLVTDYTAAEWNINRRIEEVVKQSDPWKYYNLWKMLESTGWRKFSPKGSAKKLVHYADIYIPKWNELHEELITKNFYTLQVNTDFFSDEQEVLKYLKENGNVAPYAFLEYLNSPQESETESPKTPRTPHRKLAAILDKDGSYQKVRHKGAYHFNAMWDSLEDLGYRNVVEKGPFENTIYIIPTARIKLEEKLGKNIENYQRVDTKSLTDGVDYFRSKEQLISYATEHYREFRGPKVELKKNKISKKNQSIVTAPARKASNTKRNNNIETTPRSSSSSSTKAFNEGETMNDILSIEPCDFDALWVHLQKYCSWTSSTDAHGKTKYISTWAQWCDNEDDKQLNYHFFYDKNEVINFCRKNSKVEIGATKVSHSSNNDVSHGRSKKRSSQQPDDFHNNNDKVKKRNMGLDTIEKLTKTPQDAILRIRYIMKENGKWEDDHSSNKFPSIWAILSEEFGWENLNIYSGHHESAAYFTAKAIDKIKEIEGVETVKIVDKISFLSLIENEDYFFNKEDIFKYVDITYCGADDSKYADQGKVGRRRGSVTQITNPDVNKNAAKIEEKPKQKSVNTPKNHKRKSETYVSPPSTAHDSMTSETEEEECQRLVRDGEMRFGHLWEALKEHGWRTANSTKEIPNNFWVAPWGHSKKGAFLKKYVYDTSKLVRNKDYFVEEKEVIDYFVNYGFEETMNEIIPTKDKGIGKMYNTRHHSIHSDNESDDENSKGEFKLNKVDNLPAIRRVLDDRMDKDPISKSKMMDETDQITRLLTNQSSPDVNGTFNSNTPNKRSAGCFDLPSSKKLKTTTPIINEDHNIKTIEQCIKLAKDSLTTDNLIDLHVVERDREFAQLKECIANALVNTEGRGIYICGSPGGGKTLLVNQVIRDFKKSLGDLDEEEDEYDSDINNKQMYLLGSPHTSPFQIIRMTGTSIRNSNQFYSKLCDELEGDDTTNTKAVEMKTKVFQRFINTPFQGKQSPKTPSSMIVLVIDEIDRLPLDIVTELYNAAAQQHSTLILVGIANDINFPEERLMGLSHDARPDPIIVFETYSADQLKDILRRRLYSLADDAALTFLAGKSKKTGDVRSLIDMASKCVSFAESKLKEEGKRMDTLLEAPIITSKIVNGALKAFQGDPEIESLNKTSRNGIHLLLSLSVSNDNNRTFTVSEMHIAYNTWTDQQSLPEVSFDEFRARFEELNNNGFLAPENLAGFGSRSIRAQQGKSQQKYHLKVSTSKLLKVCKEKNYQLGVGELETIFNKNKASYDEGL